MAFNLALKVALIESRKKQIDVAQRAGIHETKFSKIVNGYRVPSADEKRAIARILRRPIQELFPEDDPAVVS